MVEIRKHGQGTHSTKMGADSPAKNTPNASKNFCSSPKVRDFWKKALRVSLVRVQNETYKIKEIEKKGHLRL